MITRLKSLAKQIEIETIVHRADLSGRVQFRGAAKVVAVLMVMPL